MRFLSFHSHPRVTAKKLILTRRRCLHVATPYGQLPSLTNSVSPKLSAASPSPSLPPTTATPAAPATHSTTARLPGLTTSLGGATPASSASSSVAGSPAPGAGSATPSYRNPMSVSSMLSGPSRDRPIPSYSSLAASSASATGSATPPQPPVLPPSAGQHLNSPKVENGKSVSPGPPSTSSFLGGLRRLSDHNNGVSTNSKPTSGSSVTPKPIGGEKSPLSIAKSAADAKDGKDASSSIPTTKGERSYPPLPSAFARESPYSSSWSSTHKPEHGYGASSSNSSKESTPPVLPPAVSNAPKTFFSNLNSFSRPQAPSATNPSNGSSSSHRHSNSLPGQPSFPPTFPWATQPSTQQQQQPQQQPPQRTYTDFYQNRGAGADGLRAQEEKRKADAVIAAAVAAEDERKGYGATSGWYRDSRGNRHHVSDPKRHIDPIDLQLKDAAIKKYNEAKSGLAAAASSGNFGDSTAGHKRRLSQGPASSSRPHDLGPSTSASSAPAPPPAKVPKPTVAPFTLADQRKAAIRPPLVNVDNSAVTKALSLSASSSSLAANLINDASDVSSAPLKPRRAHLGRVVYSPFTPPATLLDGNLLRSNIGGIVEVAINAGWLSSSSVASSLEIGGTVFEVGDPREYDGKPIRGTGKKTSAPGLPESVWDLEPIKKRKVWGSDVYTDDSDVLALALHSGWLRLGKRGVVAGAPVEPEEGEGPPPPTKAGEKGAGDEAVRRAKLPGLTLKQRTAKEEKDKEVPGGEVNEARQRTILVRLIVGPTLVRYEGCERQGIKSRSWGNGHDGVSLVIDSVETLEVRLSSLLGFAAALC